MPRTIRTSGDYAVDRELDALWHALDAIKRLEVETAQDGDDAVRVSGVQSIAELGLPGVDGHVTLSEGDAIIIQQSDRDFAFSVDLCDDTPQDVVGASAVVVPEFVDTFTDTDGTRLHTGGHVSDTGHTWIYARTSIGPSPGPYAIVSSGRTQHDGGTGGFTTGAIIADPLISATPSAHCQLDFDFVPSSGLWITNVAMLCTYVTDYTYWNNEGVYIIAGPWYGGEMDEWGITCIVPGTVVDGDGYVYPFGPLSDALHHTTIYHAPEGANYRVRVTIDSVQLLDFAYEPDSGLGARNRIGIQIGATAPTSTYVDNIVIGQIVAGGASPGVASVPSRCDHTHLGVRSLNIHTASGAGSELYGDIQLSENGGLEIGQTLDENMILLSNGWRRSFLIG